MTAPGQSPVTAGQNQAWCSRSNPQRVPMPLWHLTSRKVVHNAVAQDKPQCVFASSTGGRAGLNPPGTITVTLNIYRKGSQTYICSMVTSGS